MVDKTEDIKAYPVMSNRITLNPEWNVLQTLKTEHKELEIFQP